MACFYQTKKLSRVVVDPHCSPSRLRMASSVPFLPEKRHSEWGRSTVIPCEKAARESLWCVCLFLLPLFIGV